MHLKKYNPFQEDTNTNLAFQTYSFWQIVLDFERLYPGVRDNFRNNWSKIKGNLKNIFIKEDGVSIKSAEGHALILLLKSLPEGNKIS